MSKSLEQQLEETLVTGLEFSAGQAKHYILDSLACALHNEGYAIQGNREENDHKWLARAMWCARNGEASGVFDTLSDDSKEEWYKLARAAINALPGLMGRIAQRAVSYSKALRSLDRAVRLEQSRPGKAQLFEYAYDLAPCYCGHVRALHGREGCVGKALHERDGVCRCREFKINE